MSLAPASVSAMQSAVLTWYAMHARDLAFRRTTDPWAVLVSEVIAQQTQAARAADAWTRLIAEFPTPAALASASPAAVIRAWRGLGYNRRALALRNAAIVIVRDHGGRVPESLDALVALPGIGPYTARAVTAIAFSRPVAALDTNIRRVLTRAFLDGSVPARELQAAADALVPPARAGAWTHALMDVGAAFCRKRDPRCDACPLRAWCAYPGSKTASGSPKVSDTRPKPRFESTTRWLRGRILDRLRDAADGEWIAFDQPIGAHPAAAVADAASAMSNEGTIEVAPGQPLLARLPVG